jgi:hypothetical protein
LGLLGLIFGFVILTLGLVFGLVGRGIGHCAGDPGGGVCHPGRPAGSDFLTLPPDEWSRWPF